MSWKHCTFQMELGLWRWCWWEVQQICKGAKDAQCIAGAGEPKQDSQTASGTPTLCMPAASLFAAAAAGYWVLMPPEA
eukprot:477994-Pelagomonas_calceolata.AAC.2